MGKLLLGIDVGTFSSKGVLVETNGNVLKSFITEHKMEIPHPGWAEQDAEKVWWADLVKICQVLLDGHPYCGEDVGGIAVSAIGPCLLPLDKKGTPLRPGILYGVDARASKEIEELNSLIGDKNIYEFSNMALTSQAIGPKILWIKHNEPEIWEKIDHITTASSYLVYKLTGEKVIDRHTASHFMPLMDVKNLNWSDKYADHFIDLEKLPKLGWSNELAGIVNEFGAKETGLRLGTPVAIGAVDALSEAISVGATKPGDLMIMYGSTTFFIITQKKPTPDPRMWSVSGAFEGDYNLAAGMSTTGSLTRWFRDELAAELISDSAYDHLFRNAETVPPGSNGLLMLPYFSGERTPINDPNAKGVLVGLTLANTKYDIFHAILESVAFGIRHNLETFNEIGAEVQRIVAVGGGTKSSIWLQIVSDVCGVDQIVPQMTIGASYGDAFLAGLVSGLVKMDDLNDWVKPGILIKTNSQNKKIYDELYVSYKSLYQQTKDIVHSLT